MSLFRTSSAHFSPSLVCTALALLSTTGSAHAGPLAYEGFVYPMAQPLPTMNGPMGWAAPWVGSTIMRAFTPALAHPSALPPSGIALQSLTVGEGWRHFGAPVNNAGGELWISFMQRTNGGPTGAFVSLDTPAVVPPSIVVEKLGGGVVRLAAGGPPVFAGFSGGVGVVDFFIVRLTQWNGASTTVELYLNPGAILGPPSATVIVPSAVPYNLTRFYYRCDPDQYLDEIRVGTTPGDVALSRAPGGCYANCDGSGAAPCLNVNDFSCFLNKFAAGDPYANCDGSTAAPVLNVNDFSCFLNRFAAGCPGC